MHGDPVRVEGSEMLARAIQHETDHLDGVLFFDRMRSFTSLTFLDEYSRYWVKDKD
jgi:peptide deformylase